jgi:hypothetical protein
MIQIIFGWPFIILSLLFSLAGLIARRYWSLLIGAVLFFPFSYYLSGAPGIRTIALALPLFQVGAGMMVRRQMAILAWLLTIPAFFVSGWTAFLVLSQ